MNTKETGDDNSVSMLLLSLLAVVIAHRGLY